MDASSAPAGLNFLPAATLEEAVERVFSLTGASDTGTRGEKRAVLALRDALGVQVETGATSDRMGAAIAESLGIRWRPGYLNRSKINLEGLNALLLGAGIAYAEGSLRRLQDLRPDLLAGPEWSEFVPARSKIEAVNRISSLTGSGAERLGPGGKEHKRVLINLVMGLQLGIPITTKHGTARALAEAFAAPWSDACVSTQGTITLPGLNVLLAGAERWLGLLGNTQALSFGTPGEEGEALLAALVDGFRPQRFNDGAERVHWDGKRAIEWLQRNETGQENQSEWQGFYWEFQARRILNRAFAPNPSPPRTKYGPEAFDYSLNFVWDMKAHTEFWRNPSSGELSKGEPGSPLNDALSMDSCIDDQGLGFLIVNGTAIEDVDERFKRWHNEFKGKPSAPSNSGRSRRRKAAFEPLCVDAYWFADALSLEAAKAMGWLTGFRQGPQAPRLVGERGAARAHKYTLTSKAAGTSLHLARYHFPQKPGRESI